jgi:hypothetical protein
VPHAIVRDTATSWEQYRQLIGELGEAVPRGLLIRAAGPTPEGVREIEVWRSRSDLERYERGRLARAAARTTRPLREPIVRELTVRHLVPPLDRRPNEPQHRR